MHPTYWTTALLVGVTLVLGACTLPNEPSEGVEFTDVELGSPAWAVSAARDSTFLAAYPFRNYSGVATAQRRVVRTTEEYAGLWEQLNAGRTPAMPAPSIDMGEEMVVFVSLGQRSTGGYSVSIRHVTVLRDTLWVLVTERAAGPTCLVTAALSQPTDARVVPRTTLPVRFRIRQEQLDCR